MAPILVSLRLPDLLHFTTPSFIQLFRLCQLLIEYLLNVQNYLLDEQRSKEDELVQVLQKMIALKEKQKKREAGYVHKVSVLKKQLKYATEAIEVYEKYNGVVPRSRMRQDRERSKGRIHSEEEKEEERKHRGTSTKKGGKDKFPCTECSAVFKTGLYLQSHYKRRHPGKVPLDGEEEKEQEHVEHEQKRKVVSEKDDVPRKKEATAGTPQDQCYTRLSSVLRWPIDCPDDAHSSFGFFVSVLQPSPSRTWRSGSAT